MDCTINELYPWLYSIKDTLGVFCYLVAGEDAALLFDTGHGVSNLPEAVRSITSKPVTVVLGHGHIDHACGAYQFDKAYLHEADFELCREHTSPPYRTNILSNLKEAGVGTPEWLDEKAFKAAGTGNLKALDHSKELDLGGLSVRFVEMPGHTAGSVGALIGGKRVLLTSDAASNHVWLFLNESLSMREYIATLENTLSLDFDTFFTGHSNEPRPKSDFHKYIKAAKDATIEKASPYNVFEDLDPYIYKDDGTEIVFNRRTLGI